MPRVCVWLLRAALGSLVLGFTVGAVMLASKGLGLGFALNQQLRPAHRELLLVGWTMQLVMGVALWIFPRQQLRALPYGREWLAWLTLALLNTGVWLVLVGSLMAPRAGGWLVFGGRLAEIGAAAAFAANLWGRIRPAGLSQI